jgi:hypothetical protein
MSTQRERTPTKPPREYRLPPEGKYLVGGQVYLMGHNDATVTPLAFDQAMLLRKKIATLNKLRGRGLGVPPIYKLVEVDNRGVPIVQERL